MTYAAGLSSTACLGQAICHAWPANLQDVQHRMCVNAQMQDVEIVFVAEEQIPPRLPLPVAPPAKESLLVGDRCMPNTTVHQKAISQVGPTATISFSGACMQCCCCSLLAIMCHRSALRGIVYQIMHCTLT